MRLSRTNILLAGLLALVMLLCATSHVDYSRPNVQVLPDMKYTPAWMAYRENPVFANGRTLQTPVSGTIPRGPMPIYFQASKEDAVRAGEEIKNPFGMDPTREVTELPESIRRGGEVYRTFCKCCHGADGAGDGPVPQRGFPPPPSMLTGNSLQMKDGQLFHILTYGQGSMASFAGQLEPHRRWDVINYVRSLQPSPAAADGEAGIATESPDRDSQSPEPGAVEDDKQTEITNPTTNQEKAHDGSTSKTER